MTHCYDNHGEYATERVPLNWQEPSRCPRPAKKPLIVRIIRKILGR